ncbi:hypothetical protein CMT52_17725 [Elizabethkingia anophelis]|nr:hypothetical protein [Elizabethkingia anophelis]MDV3661647.1 hypothetical protein [Elizabethkingia anophelis]MDV4026174.1 hypothetical protein [Elizabethkingia anophelis]
MTVEEYLKSCPPVKLARIAEAMYPNNNYAATALNSKLKNIDKRSFTREDAELALKALKKFSDEMLSLTID